jgi:hypothetical protein
MHTLDERSGALAFRPRLEAPPRERPCESAEDELARRQQRKAQKLLADASRPLDPWERYRALVDTFEQGIDLAEMADRKVRFAMVVMASLNIGLFAFTTRPELLGVTQLSLRGWLGAYLLAYAVVAVYFFVQAVDALRPRPATAPGEPRGGPPAAASRLRRLERVVAQDVAEYASAWREVRFDQLHAELALQNHRLSQVNEEKYAALGRLYGGLRVLALLLGGLVFFAGLSSVLASFAGTP